MAPGLLDAIRAALAKRDDVRLAVVFGSVARGRDDAGSDVDVAVQAPGANLLDLAAYLREELGREVDVVDLASAGYPLLQAIVRDGVVVRQSRHGAEAEWRSRAITTLETDRPWFERMRDAYLERAAQRT